jgi:hypothetical protein
MKADVPMHVKSDCFGCSTAWSRVFAIASNYVLFKYVKNHLQCPYVTLQPFVSLDFLFRSVVVLV